MGRPGMHIGYWENQKESDHQECFDIDEIILRCSLEKHDKVVWTGLIWLRRGICGELS
jgi:hypothetical protein